MTTDTKPHQNFPSSNKLGRVGDTGDPAIIPELTVNSDELRGKPSLSMIGLLLVTMIIGYEWFISGLVKIVRGDFPSGLADELVEKSVGAPAW